MVQVRFDRLAFFLFACTLATFAFGQKAPLDEDKWADLTEGKSFTEEVSESREKTDLPNFDFDINATIVKYVVFFIVLALLLYVLVRYLLSLQSNAVKEEDVKIEVNTLQEAEENPMQADLVKLIAKLIDETNFREATRAYFLLVLQQLYHRNFIDWQKPKTNFDYVSEVSEQPFYAKFNGLTAYFEMTWYGAKSLAKEDFILIEPEFKKLVNTIGDARKK